MTLRVQPPGLADRILALLGKRRAVCLPSMKEPYGYYIAKRESFLRALVRPRGMPPQSGWFYPDAMENGPTADPEHP
jgi:hypothetical protein